MIKKEIDAILERMAALPQDAREELARIAREIEAELRGGTYRATPQEPRGIDRGPHDAAEGKFASVKEVEAVFAKHRRA
jgi:hypothetical protein